MNDVFGASEREMTFESPQREFCRRKEKMDAKKKRKKRLTFDVFAHSVHTILSFHA